MDWGIESMKRLYLYCGLCVCLTSQITSQVATPQTATSQKPISTQKTLPAKKPAFDTVSIKPIEKPDSRFFNAAQPQATPDGYRSIPEQSLWATIMLAYYETSKSPLYWRKSMLSGAPPWLMKNQYAIDARIAPEDLGAWQKPDPDRNMLRSALQQMLKERCRLVLHRTTTVQPVYALVIQQGAKLKLKEAGPDEVLPEGVGHFAYDGGFKYLDEGSIGFYKMSMNYVKAFLTATGADRPVIDMTGLKARYDFVLPRLPRDEDESVYAFPWDLESIGLTLKPIKAPIETLVIDHIEEPSPN